TSVAMIHSLFLLNPAGDVFLEKHWQSPVSRSVCDYWLEAKERAAGRASAHSAGGSAGGGGGGGGGGSASASCLAEAVAPVLATPHHYVLSALRGKVSLLAVTRSEAPPLFIIEFLHRVADTLQDYFGECTEAAIRENCVVVYELLEEMLDNGFPLATEANILKELIKPPTILRSVVNSITGERERELPKRKEGKNSTARSSTIAGSRTTHEPQKQQQLQQTPPPRQQQHMVPQRQQQQQPGEGKQRQQQQQQQQQHPPHSSNG
ncbi:unnamed protein product, partial [Lampetra fluviatilis]